MIPNSTYPIDILQTDILDTAPLNIVVYRQEGEQIYRVVWANRLVHEQTQLPELAGKLVNELVPPSEVGRAMQRLRDCCATGQPVVVEESFTLPIGQVWFRAIYKLLPQRSGLPKHILVTTEDITLVRQREQEEREQQEIMIAQQQATLAELSTPLLAITDETVVMPVIGTVDSRRVQQIMIALLEGVAEMRARTVILDITGVPIVDTQVANALLHASQAVKLLGAQVVLTGIRPEVAQTLVGLGVDLAGIITLSSLQSGIAFALKR
ncbi:STAS domain-containing protein [Chloroflexia bacterium SDU3-3]|nr:STAS domain-containing protein [Chloroflexia bacterium SDU3-3]